MYPCVHKGDQENSEATPNFDISKVKKEDPDSSNNMDWQVEDFEGSENNASFETNENGEISFEKCGLCNIIFRNKASLKEHNMSVHKNTKRLYHTSFVCAICNSSFPYKADLKNHMTVGKSNY